MKKIIYLCCLILAIISCSKQERLPEKKLNVTFEKIGEIRENENNLTTITDCSVHDNQIYVLDDCEQQIFHYNINGELLGTFGKKGKGPGEFIMPMDISSLEDKIIIFDYNKRSIIEFNFDGSFIKEWIIGKDNFIQRRLILEQKSKILGYNSALIHKDLKYHQRESISTFDQNLNIIKDICVIDSSLYDPYYIDYLYRTKYALDPRHDKVALANPSYEHIDFTIINIENELSNRKIFQINPVEFCDKNINYYKTKYDEIKHTYSNYTLTFAEIPQYRQAISSMDFDDKGNLWISSPIDDFGKQKLLVFSNDGKYLGHVLFDAVNIKIENGYLFTQQKDQEDESERGVILIYKINWLDT